MENRNFKLLLDSCQNLNGEVFTYLHNTKSEQTAQAILNNGFQFQSHIEYSSDIVSTKEPITIKYFTSIRKAYGTYTLIIQVSKRLVDKISKQLKGIDNDYSEILSYAAPQTIEGECLYKLAPQFLKGYVDNKQEEFIANPIFNPDHFPEEFAANISAILDRK